MTPAAAALGPNDIKFTLTTPTGSAMAGATVKVYYWPGGDLPAGYVPAIIASGRAGSRGVFTATLNVSAVSEPAEYNAELIAVDSAHHWAAAVTFVPTRDASYAGAATGTIDLSLVPDAAAATDDELTQIVSTNDGLTASDPDGGDPNLPYLTADPDMPPWPSSPYAIGSETKRWVKVAVWNVADGMTSSFTYSAGVRETSTQTLKTKAGGGFEAGGWWTESKERGSWGSPPDKTASYHKIRYAEYRYVRKQTCLRYYCYYRWYPNNWTGGLTQTSDYTPPAFKSQYAVILNGTRGRNDGNIRVRCGTHIGRYWALLRGSV